MVNYSLFQIYTFQSDVNVIQAELSQWIMCLIMNYVFGCISQNPLHNHIKNSVGLMIRIGHCMCVCVCVCLLTFEGIQCCIFH